MLLFVCFFFNLWKCCVLFGEEGEELLVSKQTRATQKENPEDKR